MQLKIVSPEKILFVGEVGRVVVPGSIGMFEILENHAPIISSLEKGVVTYKPAGTEATSLEIQGGFVEVQKNEVRLCVEL